MTWNSIMGFISSVALFLPILFILVLRLGGYKTFPALLSYYVIFLVYNMMTQAYIKASPGSVYDWNIFKNLVDVPLALVFLTYFSTSPAFTRKMKITIASIIVFESIVVLIKGFNNAALAITMGPALLIVVLFCIYFFIRQTKITIMHQKATGKAIIAASLLFAYGCYMIIYLMYYVFKTQHVADTFLVYFLVATFSSLLMCTGIIIERKRIQKLNELKQTRKELSDLYKDTQPTTAPLRTAILDFDKDQWN